VISEEHPNIFCRTIDLERAAAGSESAEKQFSLLMCEIRSTSRETHVAWRGGRRFEKTYNTLKVPAPRSAPRIRPDGVYLHTAPLSEGGLAMVRYLAQHGKPKLALFLPADFPERNKWNTLKALNNPREKSTRAVTQLLEMEAAGAEIMAVKAVMNDERQVREGVAAVIAKFGSIHGVIHGAGVVDRKASRQLRDIDTAFLDRQILGNISAVRALEESLKGQNPDFVFLFTPLSASLAGSGMAAAAVLGRFINSLAEQKNLSGQMQWIAVNVESRTVEGERSEEVMARLLTSIEGPAVFVSPEDFRSRLTTQAEVSEFAALGWVDPNTPVPETEIAPEILDPQPEAVPQAAANGHSEGATAVGGTAQGDATNNDVLRPAGVVLPPAHPRPNLPVPFVAPSNETEHKVAVIWQDILRLREVGIKDNFFQLNGDSLLATQLMARLRTAFQIDLPLRYFFEYPTIEAMAKAVLTAKEKGIGSQRPAIARVSRGDRTRALGVPSPRPPRAIGAVGAAGDAVKKEETE
jgi:NAD(P)-dependent dehydrogenase (short-subunit alcohol dehydrogenase family)/acyl carrier protein